METELGCFVTALPEEAFWQLEKQGQLLLRAFLTKRACSCLPTKAWYTYCVSKQWDDSECFFDWGKRLQYGWPWLPEQYSVKSVQNVVVGVCETETTTLSKTLKGHFKPFCVLPLALTICSLGKPLRSWCHQPLINIDANHVITCSMNLPSQYQTSIPNQLLYLDWNLRFDSSSQAREGPFGWRGSPLDCSRTGVRDESESTLLVAVQSWLKLCLSF